MQSRTIAKDLPNDKEDRAIQDRLLRQFPEQRFNQTTERVWRKSSACEDNSGWIKRKKGDGRDDHRLNCKNR